MKKTVCMLLAFVIFISMCGNILALEDDEKNVMRVGINAEYPPFEYYERGEYAGFDIDLMIFVGIAMGYDIEFVNMEFDALFRAVNEGTVDCAISAITYTEERDAVLDFTEPYLTAKVEYTENGMMTESIESYHVVFKNGAADDETSLYDEVNQAIIDLKDMGMIPTLTQKHKLVSVEDDEYNVILAINPDGSVELVENENDTETVIPQVKEYKHSTWAEDYIKRADSLGWALWQDTTVDITRGEFCRVAEQFLYSCGLNVSFFAMNTPFTDIGEGFGGETGAIKYLYCLDIVEGKSETLFCPDDYITREEAAVIMTRIIDCFRAFKIADIKADALNDWAYVDHEDIAPWAAEAVYKISNLNIMQGTDKGFEPKGNITYEQTVAMLLRLYDRRWSIEPTMFADKMNALMPEDENYMFSPLSIKMALMLAANGADEETEDEICDAFDEYDVDAYNEKAKKMIEKYSEIDILSLDIANSIWVNKSHTDADFASEFESAAKDFYTAEVGRVDKSDASKTINAWVSEKTKGKINSILPEGYTDFFAAIVNAIYFKGAWENDFSEALTKKDNFTNADGTVVETDFMNQTDYFNYYDDGVTKIVEMPYQNMVVTTDEETGIINRDVHEDLNISMYIIMSEEDINLEEKIWFATQGYGFNIERVNLSIPKFEVEYSTSLKETLSQLGFEKVFGLGFDKVLQNERLFVNDVFHKTCIKVDEEGTEAAAVTAVMAGASAMPPEPVEFKADKPFWFVIRDNVSEEILFMGRYAFAE